MYRIFILTLVSVVFFVYSVMAVESPPSSKDGLHNLSKSKESPKTLKDPTTGMEFVLVKGGCYQMGDVFRDGFKDEKPVHEVCLNDFYFGKYEVTQRQWIKVMGANPSYFTKCGPECPVEQVSWETIRAFIDKLNLLSSKHYRLPTEAEWEFAARSGGKEEKWAGTNDESTLDNYVWDIRNSSKKTHRVGKKQANNLGLYDMNGNVSELCSDWYDENYYTHSPKENPQSTSGGEYLVMRGGSWEHNAGLDRTMGRGSVDANKGFNFLGFRLLLPVNQ